MSENDFSLSTHKLTCVDIVVSVLGTVGYGNIMNSIWIINNFLHSCKYSRGESVGRTTSEGSYMTGTSGRNHILQL